MPQNTITEQTRFALPSDSSETMSDNPFRNLPSMTQILESPILAERNGEHSHEQMVAAIRDELDEARQQLRQGIDPAQCCDIERIAQHAIDRLIQSHRPKIVPVINATGIVLHTNLGRAPLPQEALDAIQHSAGGYLNLELALETGKRSSRQDAVREWLVRLTGAESATVVNNNAAATVLVLRALCKDREVIVSRGQLVEIGGSFRIPDIMGVSGATLREVGTTNITRIGDYESAITEQTAALLRVHCSNYCISGFTKSASLEEMVQLGQQRNLPVIDDVGSGALLDFERFGFTGEPVVVDSVQAGADVVLFSGDKLLGGPQAGLIVGKADLIKKLERDPLMRAFRLDRLTLTALEATLRVYLHEARALQQIPTLRMLSATLDELHQRAVRVAEKIKAVPGISQAVVVEDEAFVGGGSLPDQSMKTIVIEVISEKESEEQLAQRLRTGTPAVLPRLRDGKVILDVRTVFEEQESALVNAFQQSTDSV